MLKSVSSRNGTDFNLMEVRFMAILETHDLRKIYGSAVQGPDLRVAGTIYFPQVMGLQNGHKTGEKHSATKGLRSMFN